MLNLKIKTRILLFVVLFEVLAYSAIVLFSNYFYSTELSDIKKREIIQTFQSKVERIDHSILLMEQNVFNLAQQGAALYRYHTQEKQSLAQLQSEFSRHLRTHFNFFEQALGGGIWFEPYLIEPSTVYFGPYVYRDEGNVVFSWDLSTKEYDYHNQAWYQLGKVASLKGLTTVWTEPYIDEAGSFAPMMTVDSPIYDTTGRFIGLATVDWSLLELTQLLNQVKITENASAFLIHKSSKQIISFSLEPKLAMTKANTHAWAKQAIESSKINDLTIKYNITLNDTVFDMYTVETQSGFIFGSLSPQSDISNAIKQVSIITVLGGALIGALFILIMFLLMKYLFYPFDLVIKLIKGSISHPQDRKISVCKITYKKNNEFTPIVEELNQVYEQVNDYIETIKRSNQALSISQAEIHALNEQLEEKVKQRTEALNIKTQEAVSALSNLKSAQKQLIEQEKHASLGRLVAGIAHEINTPLGISITASSYLEGEVKTIAEQLATNALSKAELERSLDAIKESCFILTANLHRTAELVASFKQVSVDQASEQKREIELNTYIEDIIRTLQPRFNNTSIAIALKQNTETITIDCYPGAIAQVVTNIIENARIHAFDNLEKGLITLSLSCCNEWVELSISDNGKGMPKTVSDAIFDPFFTTNRDSGGSGLGMHLVFNMVSQQLDGTIVCTSQINKGTQFIIRLPNTKSVNSVN